MIQGGGAGEGLAALCGHQSGDKGARDERPALSREIEYSHLVFPLPGASSAFFSFEAILGDLVRWRTSGKKGVGDVLPPRRMWSRPGLKERKGVLPETVRRRAIRRTVLRLRSEGRLAEFQWGRNLAALVDRVQSCVMSGNVAFEPPTLINIVKCYENGKPKFRQVASFERLEDRVILSRMTAYVRDRLESVLSGRCYSFRRDATITHQTAVEHLLEYRKKFSDGSLFVAECDIRKFFDSISHDVIRRCWDKLGFDASANAVLEAYLAVYSASETERRGVPQGGSFSTVLANLVLSAADNAVETTDDRRLFYARYCDDVIFIHPDEAACRRAMSAYGETLASLDLPMHPVRPFVYRPADGTATRYYEIKSKGSFRWRAAEKGEAGCSPWVSFLGSQIRFDGESRIRKESIEKHIRALGKETAKAVREIERETAPILGRRSASAWFARFRNHLIAKGVGYVTAKVEDCRMCWAGAFPSVTKSAGAEAKMQMRRLDRIREGMLARVWESLRRRLGDKSLCGTKTEGEFVVRRRRFKGRPFSYYAFLEKAVRPTNMARRARMRTLPYSEL